MKAGFARLDMTPPLGTPLAGYYSQRLATDVLDPLSLNALVLSDGGSTAVLIAADMLGIRRAYTDEIRALVAERVGIPADHVMLCSLHQHTSMRLADAWERSAVTDKTYLDVFYRKVTSVRWRSTILRKRPYLMRKRKRLSRSPLFAAIS